MTTRTDEQLILNHLQSPNGSVRTLMVLNGWKWPKVRAVIIKHKLSINSYLVDALSNEFRDPADPFLWG